MMIPVVLASISDFSGCSSHLEARSLLGNGPSRDRDEILALNTWLLVSDFSVCGAYPQLQLNVKCHLQGSRDTRDSNTSSALFGVNCSQLSLAVECSSWATGCVRACVCVSSLSLRATNYDFLDSNQAGGMAVTS